MAMEKREAIIRNYIKAYNNFDVEGMLADFTEDIIFENIQNQVTTDSLIGKEAFREQAEQAKDFFSQRKQTIKAIKLQEDYVEIDIDYEATLAIDFPGSIKKGEKINLQGKSIFTFNTDYKIEKLLDIS